MMESMNNLVSYDGGDTGFLNAFFPTWFEAPSGNRLNFRYNAQRTLFWITHKSQPGYWDAIGTKKIIHFSSSPKPWLDVNHKGELEMLWWSTYTELLAASSSTF
jgi:glycogenin glucosyltransferase